MKKDRMFEDENQWENSIIVTSGSEIFKGTSSNLGAVFVPPKIMERL
jgi:hypothetical protein